MNFHRIQGNIALKAEIVYDTVGRPKCYKECWNNQQRFCVVLENGVAKCESHFADCLHQPSHEPFAIVQLCNHSVNGCSNTSQILSLSLCTFNQRNHLRNCTRPRLVCFCLKSTSALDELLSAQALLDDVMPNIFKSKAHTKRQRGCVPAPIHS